jgi:hypothetical protein
LKPAKAGFLLAGLKLILNFKAYASHTVIPRGVNMTFLTNPFVRPTFLQPLKKVGKKSRSQAMLFTQLLSRSFALAPGNGKLI